MLKVKKDNTSGITNVTLSGTVDEQDDLGTLIGKPSGTLYVSCKDVTRINSMGIKRWIKYFEELNAQKIQVVFSEMSCALVEQLNIVKNFSCGGEVESFMLPYACPKCGHSFQLTANSADIRKAGLALPPAKCTKCNSPAEFDEIPEEYLSFLQKR